MSDPSRSRARADTRFERPIPAGGMAFPPSDPPPASPTPLRGQQETNRPALGRESLSATPASGRKQDDIYSAAFEFGWQSRLQYGRAAATNISFEKVEPELEKQWSQHQAAKDKATNDKATKDNAAKEKLLPWQAARDTARDAWNQVYEALAGDSQAKTNTNG